ncbi:hypothetical protein [Acetobacter okinawensis]|uniref:hypothetical protein n=1 Tax=Acetobacter okinawensis TaxID=1076594 RepID=UPI001BACA9E9|nr:hypothetical protein [Acetobacter okinawensis]
MPSATLLGEIKFIFNALYSTHIPQNKRNRHGTSKYFLRFYQKNTEPIPKDANIWINQHPHLAGILAQHTCHISNKYAGRGLIFHTPPIGVKAALQAL